MTAATKGMMTPNKSNNVHPMIRQCWSKYQIIVNETSARRIVLTGPNALATGINDEGWYHPSQTLIITSVAAITADSARLQRSAVEGNRLRLACRIAVTT